ncbi:unnamed protein product [Arctia plantaginis]|uniref:Uncharacterized protein n=1 Tax=Arctia plantaginis TaxID=874455 RepID=A0A8S0YZG5_ARCPL|nr:unnamed protein product [Arctia plantaginis]CAB3256592.1 unnamed protein product [Arctia plantaginis]
MFRYACLLMLLCSLVGAKPLSCQEDAQCSEGYYCETQDKICYQCLQCEDLNRLMPLLYAFESCIKSVHDCGPCFEGFINIYEEQAEGMCVSPDRLDNEQSKLFCFYIWMTAAIAGSLIVFIFIYVIWNTYVFKISPFDYPVPIKLPKSTEWVVDFKFVTLEYTKANIVSI